MGAITISRQYGSDGRTVGFEAAKALGYHYVDKELIVRVAQEAGVPVSEVAGFDEQPEHPIRRALRKFLAPTHPHMLADMGEIWGHPVEASRLTGESTEGFAILDEDVYVQLTQKIMRRLADEKNVVLMGRGGQAYLAARPDVLHVRIFAPEAVRIQRTVELDDLEPAEASRRLRKLDEQRMRYIKRHYGVDWDAPELYHMILNTDQTGVEAAARIIVEAAKQLPVERGNAEKV